MRKGRHRKTTMAVWIPRGLGNVSMLCVLAISMCLVWLFMNEMATLDYPDAKPVHEEHNGEGVLSNLISAHQLTHMTRNVIKLHEEFSRIPPNIVNQSKVPFGTGNKNRYVDVLPNPETRVRLSGGDSGYINANFIRGYRDNPKVYIATQGPLSNTVEDFWRMVWEHKVSLIVMTTVLVEGYTEKCYQYWPEEESEVYGDIKVSMEQRQDNEHFTITKLSLLHLQDSVSRHVTHLWFTGWPDHGVPNDAKPVMDFILESRKLKRDSTSPVVAHCSAGIGRTGVFITADICMRELDRTGSVNVPKVLYTIRQDRGGMVETKEQYVFVYQILSEYERFIELKKVSS